MSNRLGGCSERIPPLLARNSAGEKREGKKKSDNFNRRSSSRVLLTRFGGVVLSALLPMGMGAMGPALIAACAFVVVDKKARLQHNANIGVVMHVHLKF